MQIREYVRPVNLEEAYALLMRGKANRILGGCTFLKRTNLKIGTAIDLGRCGLDYIRLSQDKTQVEIGAYTSLREVETSALLRDLFGDMLSEALRHLIGVQLRNLITLGAHVASRFGFSDMIPVLLALNARVRFYHSGEKTLESYLEEERPEKDILVEIIIPLEGQRGKVQMMRLSYNDYSIFCLAVSRGKVGWRVAGGNFPGRAKLAHETMRQLNKSDRPGEAAAVLADLAAEEFHFGSNYRGSAEYRKELCRVFARRAIEELSYDDPCDA